MGGFDPLLVGSGEPTVRYHSFRARVSNPHPLSGEGTVSGGQFDWGGRLLKGNGGAQRFAQAGWKSADECKSRSKLDCETNKSNRDESRL